MCTNLACCHTVDHIDHCSHHVAILLIILTTVLIAPVILSIFSVSSSGCRVKSMKTLSHFG